MQERTRGDSVSIIIRTGRYAPPAKPLVKTFPKRDLALARQWGLDRESELARGAQVDHRAIRATQVKDLLARFRDEVCPTRKGGRWETNRLNAYLREPWAYLMLDDDIASALTVWREERIRPKNGGKGIKPQSFNRDYNLLRAVFKAARLDWNIKIANPMEDVRRLKVEGGGRKTTWTPEDSQLFATHLGFDEDKPPFTSREELAWALVLADETGVRRGALALTEIAWVDLSRRCIHYPANVIKNGETYDCPLSRTAMRLIEKLIEHRKAPLPPGTNQDGDRPWLRRGQQRIGDSSRRHRLFHSSPDTLGNRLAEARAELAKLHPEQAEHLLDLDLHALRHTYTTRLVSKLRATKMDETVQKINLLAITGRKSLRELQGYFHPEAEDLAGFLD